MVRSRTFAVNSSIMMFAFAVQQKINTKMLLLTATALLNS